MSTREKQAKVSKKKPRRVADDLMAGLRELEEMLDSGKRPEEVFKVTTLEIPEPRRYTQRQLVALRAKLGVSQAAFAQLLGVSVVLVKSWERGVREPSGVACRLLETIEKNPAEWLAGLRRAKVA